jgi:NAD(P)-dependent dehydrogenase (short-subunit alcohol dehydrogenase family)
MGKLDGKTAIVTGGAGGIGAAAGRLFASEGANVMLVDLDAAALQAAVASAESNRVAWRSADVSDDVQTRAYVDATMAKFGGIDILFANAGIEGKVAPIVQSTVEDFDRVWTVNVRGVWLALRYAMPHIAARGGGSIMITSSVAGLIGFPGLAPYVASKHAVLGLMRTAALEGAAAGIRVNSIHPGPIANRMMDSLEHQLSPDTPAQAKAGMVQLVPLGRYGTNEEIAKLALFLASDDSSYCTGSAFVADGGFVTH